MTDTPSSHWPLPFASPEDCGFSSTDLDRIDVLLSNAIERKQTAGAITLVARNDHICHLKTHGMMNVESSKPMDENALFRIYSMTKPVTAVATLMLYEECAFLLDDPLKNFLPEYAEVMVKVVAEDGAETLVPPVRDITIHDVLTHTAGFGYDLFHEVWADGVTDLAEFSRRLAKEPLLAQPGKTWIYGASNDVLGRLVEVVSGMPFPQFLQERIFDPLGMKDTRFWVAPEERDRFVTLYALNDAFEIEPYTGEDKSFSKRPALFAGGSGLISTTSDYLRFCLMLLHKGTFNGQRILGRKTVDLMTVDHLPVGHPAIEPFKFGYGLGVSVVRSLAEKQGIASIGEYGWGGMASTDIWIDPEENTITMIMMQLLSKPGLRLTKRYKEAVYQALV